MKKLEIKKRTCRNCGIPMQIEFFVYALETEVHDRWLESEDLVEEYCDRCFRDSPQVVLFIEFFCPQCGDYTGIYMECTPYSTAHFLSEETATYRK